MPDELIYFFSVLLNIKKKKHYWDFTTVKLRLYYSKDDSEEILAEKQELEDEKLLTEATKIGSLFRIMSYNIHNDYQKTPLHITNVAENYEKCKSRELIILSRKEVYVLVVILWKDIAVT